MKLTKNKTLVALMIIGLVACGRGKKDAPELSEETTAQDKNLVDIDEGTPSIDDKSQSTYKHLLIAASVTGLGIGRVLMFWAPHKVEALRKFFIRVDQNEAMKINGKLLELVKARENFDKVRNSIPTQIDEALKGNIDSAETEHIKKRISELLAKRSQQLVGITQLQIQIADLEAASTERSAPLNRLQRDLSLSNTGLRQTEEEIAKVLKANAKVFKVFHTWSLARTRLDLAAKSLDLNFHRVFRSLTSKMMKLHSNRVKLKLVDSSGALVNANDHATRKTLLTVGAAEIIRKNFNLAKVTYITAGGFVIVGSGFTLWTTLSEADTEGEELALKVIEAVEDGEPLTEEEEATLSQAQ